MCALSKSFFEGKEREEGDVVFENREFTKPFMIELMREFILRKIFLTFSFFFFIITERKYCC
jgi:hypothetical protein